MLYFINIYPFLHKKSSTKLIFFQKAQKYTILVEAKDKGEKIQLSSTNTVIINILDTNNNLPVFSGKTVGFILDWKFPSFDACDCF